MPLVQVAADGDQVHDREDFSRFVEFAFEGAIIREQARDIGMAAEHLGLAGADQRVDPPAASSCASDAPLAFCSITTGLSSGGACGLPCVPVSSTAPWTQRNGIKIDAELMGQETTRPDRRRLGVERQTDALAFKVLGVRIRSAC